MQVSPRFLSVGPAESPVVVNRQCVSERCDPPSKATFWRQSGKLEVKLTWLQVNRRAIKRFYVRHRELGSQRWSEVSLTFYCIFNEKDSWWFLSRSSPHGSPPIGRYVVHRRPLNQRTQRRVSWKPWTPHWPMPCRYSVSAVSTARSATGVKSTSSHQVRSPWRPREENSLGIIVCALLCHALIFRTDREAGCN